MSGTAEPAFVRRPEIAAPFVDVGEAIIGRRKIPCICPEQERGACGRTLDYSTIRGQVVEQVACDRCCRTWTRVNC